MKIDIRLVNEDFALNQYEIEILKKISEWPRCVEISSLKLEPNRISFYLYDLVTLFHSYWNLGNENKEFRFVYQNKSVNNSRLLLLKALLIVIKKWNVNFRSINTKKHVMLKNIKYIFYLGSFLIFLILTTRFYFSDQNIRKTNKSRSFYSVELNNNTQNLTLLKNDTKNIIEYSNDVEVYKKRRKKYTFFGLLEK